MNRRRVLTLLSAASAAAWTRRVLATVSIPVQASKPDWSTLQGRVMGPVIPRASAEYERQRGAMVWNAVKPDRFPDAMVHAESDADVIEAVRFAREHRLKVTARGSGHNWHNAALRDGGLLIDLSRLQQVEVDVDRRIATVQPGVRSAVLIGRLAPNGLAFPVANAGQVGLSGFLLNGGLGRNFRAWGPSCASVEAIDMVDARGALIHADANENADLFWAARGAGSGFFGVVTRFYLKLHPLPGAMTMTTASYAIEDADRLGGWLTDLGPMASSLHLNCSLANGAWRITAIAFASSLSEAREVLQPLDSEPASLKPLAKNAHRLLSVEDVFGSPAVSPGGGPRYIGDSMVSDASPRELIAAVRGVTAGSPAGSVFSFVSLARPEGSRQSDMAFSLAATRYVHAHGLWTDPALDAASRAWVRRTMGLLEPLAAGYYVGEADLSVSPDRARRCFSPAAWDRLGPLNRKHDPDGVFFSYLTS